MKGSNEILDRTSRKVRRAPADALCLTLAAGRERQDFALPYRRILSLILGPCFASRCDRASESNQLQIMKAKEQCTRHREQHLPVNLNSAVGLSKFINTNICVKR